MGFYTTSDVFYPTNQPNLVIINNFDLPRDVVISLNGEKIIAESKILDGASVFERVGRKPFEITFDFNIRQQTVTNQYVFPTSNLTDIWENIWEVDEVVQVQNTYLNSISIQYLIVKSITPVTVRGNTHIACSIKCLEVYNYASQAKSLIIDLGANNTELTTSA